MTDTHSPSGSTVAEAETFLDAHPEIEAFDIVLHDSNGIGRGKIIRRHELLSIYKSGRHMPISILGLDICGEDVHETGLIWDQGDGDRRAADKQRHFGERPQRLMGQRRRQQTQPDNQRYSPGRGPVHPGLSGGN